MQSHQSDIYVWSSGEEREEAITIFMEHLHSVKIKWQHQSATIKSYR